MALGCNSPVENPSYQGPGQAFRFVLQTTFLDSSLTEPQNATVNLVLTGDHFFTGASSSSCAVLDHSMAAQWSQVVFIKEDGTLAFEAGLPDFSALVDALCPLGNDFRIVAGSNHEATESPTVQSLHVSVSIPASARNCKSYCKSKDSSLELDCYGSCINGDRKIIAAKTFTQSELLSIADSVDSTLRMNLDLALSFDQLSEGITASHGPDLRVDAASAERSLQVTNSVISENSCAIFEGCVAGPGRRKLLRFDGVIQNLGDQDFYLGEPSDNPLFVYSSCHGHYHLKAAMRYELIDPVSKHAVSTNYGEMPGAVAATGHKQGFCMIDMIQVAGNKDPQFTCSNQGLTSGWADVYDSGLDCQWVDVTEVPAGDYLLRISVNPDGILPESDKTNNSVEVPVTLR